MPAADYIALLDRPGAGQSTYSRGAMTDVSSATGSTLTESVPDKVVLVGDVGVGKTSIFLRFKTGKFHDTTPSHNPRDGEYQKEWQVAGSSVSVSASMFYMRNRTDGSRSMALQLQNKSRHCMSLYCMTQYIHVCDWRSIIYCLCIL